MGIVSLAPFQFESQSNPIKANPLCMSKDEIAHSQTSAPNGARQSSRQIADIIKSASRHSSNSCVGCSHDSPLTPSNFCLDAHNGRETKCPKCMKSLVGSKCFHRRFRRCLARVVGAFCQPNQKPAQFTGIGLSIVMPIARSTSLANPLFCILMYFYTR